MNPHIPHLLPRPIAKGLCLFLRQPQSAGEQGKRQPLQIAVDVDEIPPPHVLVLLVGRPDVAGPLERLDRHVDEAGLLEHGFVFGGEVDAAAEFGGGFDCHVGHSHEEGILCQGVVVGGDGEDHVCHFEVAAGGEFAGTVVGGLLPMRLICNIGKHCTYS